MSEINFQNLPNTSTPLNAQNLNEIQKKDIIMVKLNSTQAPLSEGENTIVFNNESFKEGNAFTLQSNGGVKCNVTCKVEISALLRFGYSDSSTKQTRLYKNTSQLIETTQQNATATTQAITSYFTTVNQNDIIYLKAVDSNTGTKSNINASATYMSIRKIN